MPLSASFHFFSPFHSKKKYHRQPSFNSFIFLFSISFSIFLIPHFSLLLFCLSLAIFVILLHNKNITNIWEILW